jgi:GNAT superfamily N-acetyltransferase
VNLTITRTTIGDADDLREIRLLALRDEPDAYGSTYEESRRYPRSQWVQMATEWNYYLARSNADVVGMASGGLFPPFPAARWLYGMFVRAEYRGTGVALELVRAVATWTRAADVSTLGLHVTTTVTRAAGFYTKIGFEPVGDPEPMIRDPSLRLQTMTTDLVTNGVL